MKIGVCVKHVPDTTARISINDEKNGIQTAGVKFVLSPYDEFAVEQAILLKEKHDDAQVLVFTFGGPKSVDALRSALAMGADEAFHIEDENQSSRDALVTARVLCSALQKQEVDMVFTGRQAIDDDNAQVSQMTAQLLGWPHMTVVSGFEIDGDTAKVTRDIEGGAKEIWQTPRQAVFACTKGLNDPRYPSLKGIMQAKKKPLTQLKPADLGLDASQTNARVVYERFELPSEERKQHIFEEATQENVDALVRLLREEAKVL
jgi:electron transfer flavoprotein beta subunit